MVKEVAEDVIPDIITGLMKLASLQRWLVRRLTLLINPLAFNRAPPLPPLMDTCGLNAITGPTSR